MNQTRYIVSLSPHTRHGRTIRHMMIATIIALLPAVAWGVYQFGGAALGILIAGIVGAVITEFVLSRITNQEVTIGDCHAVQVGLFLSLLIPPGAPWWIAFIGGMLAILIGKAPFGPLGSAPLSPALVGLLIIAMSWPQEISSYAQPRTAPPALHVEDAAPAESPLDAIAIDASDVADYCTTELFLGNQVGAIGTISPLLLLIGGLGLLWKKVTRWQAPLGFLVGIGAFAAIAHAMDPGAYAPGPFHLLTGATMFGAFFLCTEFSSTPVTPWGMFLFGLIAGCLTVIFRIAGMPFGQAPFAITIMALATPLFDRIVPVPFGKVVSHA